MTLMTLKAITEKLPLAKFKRIHRSYVVSLSKIKSVVNRKVKLISTELPVSTSYLSSLTEWIKKWGQIQSWNPIAIGFKVQSWKCSNYIIVYCLLLIAYWKSYAINFSSYFIFWPRLSFIPNLFRDYNLLAGRCIQIKSLGAPNGFPVQLVQSGCPASIFNNQLDSARLFISFRCPIV